MNEKQRQSCGLTYDEAATLDELLKSDLISKDVKGAVETVIDACVGHANEKSELETELDQARAENETTS